MPLLRMGTQQWHHVHSPKVGRHPPLCPAAMAPSNGTTPPKLVVFLPPQPQHTTMAAMAPLPQTYPSQYNGTLQWEPAMPLPKLVATLPPNHSTLQWHLTVARNPPKLIVSPPPTIARYNGTQQWHHLHSPKIGRHPPPTKAHYTMAPSNGTKLVVTLRPPTIAHYNGNATTTTPPKLVVPPPPNHSTLQWHPAMAPRPLHQNWRPAMAPRPLHQNWPSPSAPQPYSTLQWHPAMAPRPLHQNWSSPSAPQP